MADLSDIQTAICDLIAAVIYPDGEDGQRQPTIPVAIYAGWPDPATLESDLTHDIVGRPKRLHISVFNLPMERVPRSYPSDREQITRPPPNTYGLAVLGNTITVTGGPGDTYQVQNLAVGIAGHAHPFIHPAAENEAPETIAAALAGQIAVVIPGTVALGADIVVPPVYRVQFARVGGEGSFSREVGRTEKGFQITIWADTAENRDSLGRQVEPYLNDAYRLALGGGEYALMTRRSGTNSDRAERQGAYRRDLIYTVEWASVLTERATELVAMEVELKDPTNVVIAETLE